MKIIDCDQYSDEWWAFRVGKPSASNAKKLVTSTGTPSKQIGDYAIELANALYAGKDVDQWQGNAATDRGTELEPVARSAYEMITGSDVIEVGSFTDDNEQYLASPDGVIGGSGLLEIKNLTGIRHTKALMYYAKYKKSPTDYIPQCQMSLMTAEREWIDLFLYHPELPSIIIRNFIDDKFVSVLREQIEAVNAERDRLLCVLKAL